MLRKLRCVSSAPFGAPVEPDVYTMVARSSAPTDAIPRLQLLVRNGDAQAFERAERVAVEHEDALQRRAVVDHRVQAVVALAVVRDGELDRGIVDDAFGLRGGVRVIDRHVHRADRGQCEVEHTPFPAGGGEDGDRVALVDAEGDEAFGGGQHHAVEFAGGDLFPAAGAGFARGDDRVLAGAFDALGEQGVQGFVAADLDGSGGGVFGEHMRSFMVVRGASRRLPSGWARPRMVCVACCAVRVVRDLGSLRPSACGTAAMPCRSNRHGGVNCCVMHPMLRDRNHDGLVSGNSFSAFLWTFPTKAGGMPRVSSCAEKRCVRWGKLGLARARRFR